VEGIIVDEYTVKLTPRMKDSLKSDSLQRWLVRAEADGHPYWTHTIAQIIEQVCEQNNVTPLPHNEDERQTLWLR
jgi:hypothetical protein